MKDNNSILSISQNGPQFVPFIDREGGFLSGEGLFNPNINIGLSVLKREAQPISDVINQLEKNGWKVTDTIGDDRIVYLENNGINITAIRGPRGTVVIPSGPIRGRVFGENVEIISRGEEEGFIPRGPIRQKVNEVMESPQGFTGIGLEEFDAQHRPGASHYESSEVIQ